MGFRSRGSIGMERAGKVHGPLAMMSLRQDYLEISPASLID